MSLTTLTNLTTLFYEDIVVRHKYARMDVDRGGWRPAGAGRWEKRRAW